MTLDVTTGKGQLIPTFPGYSSYGDMNISEFISLTITQSWDFAAIHHSFLWFGPFGPSVAAVVSVLPLTAGVRVNIISKTTPNFRPRAEREQLQGQKTSTSTLWTNGIQFHSTLCTITIVSGWFRSWRRKLPFNRQKPGSGPGCCRAGGNGETCDGSMMEP